MKAEWSFVVEVARSSGVPDHHCEDVAIEVFLRLERHHASLASSGPEEIRAWLRTTTHHVAEEHSGLHQPASPPAVLLDPPALVATAEEQLIALQSHGSLRSLVDALEPERRAVFVAHLLDEDPMHEVARRLGITEGTAHHRLRLAREDLRVALLRASKGDERKQGSRSLAIVQLLVTGVAFGPGVPAAGDPAPLERAEQSIPASEWQLAAPEIGPSHPPDEGSLVTGDERRTGPRGAWRPRLLLALAASALRRGDLREAASALRLYHDEHPDDPLAEAHREVRSQLEARTR